MDSTSPLRSIRLTPDLHLALDTLALAVERETGDATASIHVLSEDGRRVLDVAGPNLPRSYRRAIHGLEIGPAAGSCGTAAYRNERVVVADIESDALWEEYRRFASRAGFAACWSQPVRSSTGDLLGTFALYYGTPRSPTEEELKLIESAAGRAATILERALGGAGRDELLLDLI
jgi:two-component system, sensor histidine kinase